MSVTRLWKWVYSRFINDPQVVTNLYEDEVDDINNALQCGNCFSIFVPEDAICPDCKKSGHFEVVFAPGIEEEELPQWEDFDRHCDACGEPPRQGETFWLSLYRTHHDDETDYGDCFSTDYLHDHCLKNRLATSKATADGYGVQNYFPCPILDSEERVSLENAGWPQAGECSREYGFADAAECQKFEHLEAEIEHQRLLAEDPTLAEGEEMIRQAVMRGVA